MHSIVYTTEPVPGKIPGFWKPESSPFTKPKEITVEPVPGLNISEACVINNLFSLTECQQLIDFMNTSPNFEEVGVQGMMDQKDERIGSLRTSIWCPEIAESVWSKIHHLIPLMTFDQYTSTDWWQNSKNPLADFKLVTAAPVAISPLLRFMKYGFEGQHYAHYDAGYIYPNHQFRTLKSMVIYLTSNNGAATRFIKDRQNQKPIWSRNHIDWSREVQPDEIIGKSECIAGNVLLFNHRICHDVQQYLGTDPRIIIRGDVVYEMLIKE